MMNGAGYQNLGAVERRRENLSLIADIKNKINNKKSLIEIGIYLI